MLWEGDTGTTVPFAVLLVFGFLWDRWCPSGKKKDIYLVVINACFCGSKCHVSWCLVMQPSLCRSGRRMWSVLCSYLRSMWLAFVLSSINGLLPNCSSVPLSLIKALKTKQQPANVFQKQSWWVKFSETVCCLTCVGHWVMQPAHLIHGKDLSRKSAYFRSFFIWSALGVTLNFTYMQFLVTTAKRKKAKKIHLSPGLQLHQVVYFGKPPLTIFLWN